MPGAQERQQHLAVEEAAAIEQREDEVDIGPIEQGLVAILDDEVEAKPPQRFAHLRMVDGMVAVLAMQAALPLCVLGNEHDAQRLPRCEWNLKRTHPGQRNWLLKKFVANA